MDGDARKLAQAFDNLLSNAVKYSPDGGTVTVRVLARDALQVEIADTGIGIARDELPALFTPFFRASTAVGAGIPGTGLGLPLVRSVVEAHGGTIAVASKERRGTTFTIELPSAGSTGS